MEFDPRVRRADAMPTPRSIDFPDQTANVPVQGATAAQIAAQQFGGPTRGNSVTVTLTTAPSVVLAGNPRRVFWMIINRGVVNAAVDIDSSMTAANGIPIGAAGGVVFSDVREDGEAVAWPVFGACDSGTCVVRVYEVMRV